jgi:hypothetical protein
MAGMDAGWIFVVLLMSAFVIAALGLVLAFRQRDAMRDVSAPPGTVGAPPRAAGRPWWGNPLVWLAIVALFVVLGIFVWPGLFGGTFLFLPFVWFWRPRPRRAGDPRANGHGESDRVRRPAP